MESHCPLGTDLSHQAWCLLSPAMLQGVPGFPSSTAESCSIVWNILLLHVSTDGHWTWTSTKGLWHCGPFPSRARGSTRYYTPHCLASGCPHGCDLPSLKGMKVKQFLEGGTLRSPPRTTLASLPLFRNLLTSPNLPAIPHRVEYVAE